MSVTAPVHRKAVHHSGLFAFSSDRTFTRSEAVALATLAAWAVLIAVLTWGTWGDLRMDTGYDFTAAARTADGQLPYVDYTYWYGPLVPALLGGVFAVAGVGVWPAVVFGLVLAVAAIALTYLLTRTFTGPLPAVLAGALVAPLAFSSANNSFVLPHAFSAVLGMVLALGALLVLARRVSADRLTPGALLAAGTLAGLVPLARPELGLALYGGLGLWLLVRVWRPLGTRRAALVEAAWLLAPMILLPGIVYGAFAAAVGLEPLVRVNLYPEAFVAAAGHVVIDAHAPWTASSVAKLLANGLLYAGGLAALLAGGALLARGGRVRTLVLGAAGLAALVFVAVVLVRPETVRYYLQFAYAWIPAGAWVIVGALLWRRGPVEASRQAVLLPVLFLATITATTYASFLPYPNPVAPEAAVYAMPVVAAVLAWLHVTVLDRRGAGALGAGVLGLLAVAGAWLVIHDARAETMTVSGPGGSLTATPADAAPLQQAVDIIGRETGVGEPILIAPQLNSLYTLADRPNALEQLSLLPGSLATPADERDAIAHLGSVRLAIIDRTPLALYEHGAFGTTFAPLLDAAVRRDFRLVRTLNGTGPEALKLEVWLRRS